jgi:nucleoside-diphosphate-sugar epimerase
MRRHRVAVVGGTGFIGSHLTECLVDSGHSVLVVARGRQRLQNLEDVAGRFVFEEGDIRDRAQMGRVLKEFRPDTVFHLAAEPDAAECPEHIRACIDSNTKGTLNVLEAANAAGARLFVYADSCKVYGNGPVPYRSLQAEDPICSYAVAKSAGWRLCKAFAHGQAIRIVGLRPTFVYGPRQNFNFITFVERSVRSGEPIRIQGGKQTRDLLYVKDAATCFANMMNAENAWGQSIPIGGGREITVSDLCREVLKVLESEADIAENALAPRSTEIWRSYCDNLQIRDLTGWSPSVNLREGLCWTLRKTPDPMETMRAVAG